MRCATIIEFNEKLFPCRDKQFHFISYFFKLDSLLFYHFVVPLGSYCEII